jgi:hypothetical protein
MLRGDAKHHERLCDNPTSTRTARLPGGSLALECGSLLPLFPVCGTSLLAVTTCRLGLRRREQARSRKAAASCRTPERLRPPSPAWPSHHTGSQGEKGQKYVSPQCRIVGRWDMVMVFCFLPSSLCLPLSGSCLPLSAFCLPVSAYSRHCRGRGVAVCLFVTSAN